ncbi:ABC transporter permease [Gammaproteobacteria bacterium]|nr:ABC transporter permease [Gammaproteobacteria bacterium]
MDLWHRHPRVFAALAIPPAGWLALFFLFPLIFIWGFSFSEKTGIIGIELTWTLDNYRRALDPLYLGIFFKSIFYAGLTTIACLIVAFPVALAITFAPAKWRAWLLLLVILPFWTNLLIRTYALIAVLRSNGFINDSIGWLWGVADGLLELIGVEGGLGKRYIPLELLYNNFAVVFGLVYVHLPFMVLPLYSALDRMDRSLIEASLDLGASQWRTFALVVIPLAAPGIISGIIITFIPALGSFLTPDLLGGTDSQMIANVIERQFKSANDWPFGAALSFLLMYVTFFVLAWQAMRQRGDRDA